MPPSSTKPPEVRKVKPQYFRSAFLNQEVSECKFVCLRQFKAKMALQHLTC